MTAKLTVTLPDDLLARLDDAGIKLRQRRSDIVREALLRYFGEDSDEVASPEEIAAIEQGREQIVRGDHVTLEEALHALERDPRTGRRKAAGPAAA